MEEVGSLKNMEDSHGRLIYSRSQWSFDCIAPRPNPTILHIFSLFYSMMYFLRANYNLCCLIRRLDNVDLGTACGKYFRVCCLSIIDPGTLLIH